MRAHTGVHALISECVFGDFTSCGPWCLQTKTPPFSNVELLLTKASYIPALVEGPQERQW